MNVYAVIILTALLVEFLLSRIADVFNLKELSGTLPKEFEGFFDAEKYKKSQDYTRVNTRFGYVTETFDLVLILVFWFAGGFNWLDQFLRPYDLHMIWTGLLFIGLLGIGRMIISLPFSIYSTFVIEEKFGFNKTTVKTFILDRVKGLFLSLVIGGPLLAGILAIFQYLGDIAWLVGWGVVTLFTILLQYIAPRWIMPLFNKFTPLEEGELKDRILAYADSVDYPLAGVYKIDGSKRSTKSNAFFTGFGKNKRIALFDTLIDQHTVPELVAVLAHEIGHYKKKHILTGMIISIAHAGVMFFLLSLFLTQEGLFNAFYMEEISIYAGLLFFGLLYSPVELILSLALNSFSRHNEYQADRFAVETTDAPEAMIDALKKLSVNNLSNLRPHTFYVFLHYSHPPVLQRIKAIRRIAKEE